MLHWTVALAALCIGLVALLTYLPAFKIQFYDGWWYLIWSATMDLPRYLIQFFDPANITQGYRPVQGLYMYLLYHLFGFNPDGYHWAHNLLHAANAILVFLIVGKLSARWRLAFVAALIYAVLPNYALAVFWHAVVDPLAGFFYLLTMLLWTRYLDTQRARDYAFAFSAFVFALFSKEIAIFLPLFLFLIEWWFYRVQSNLRAFAPRYVPFLITFIPYLYLVYQVQSHGEFVGQFGFRIGPHMLGNLIPYAAVLAFPWFTNLPNDMLAYMWLGIVALAYIGVMIYKWRTDASAARFYLFLALFAVLNVSPLLGFPLDYFHPRYLYLSTISSAVILALIFEQLWTIVGVRRVASVVIAFAVGLVVIVSSAQVAESAAGLAEYTRQIRVPFRDIAREHPTFPPGTYVYFVNSPKTSIWDFEGLFFARYRQNVTVKGTDGGHIPQLREYPNAYVYYFDPTGKPIEIAVDKDDVARVTPVLPARFHTIVLERAAIPTTVIARDKALVVIFVWRVSTVVEKDYTLFLHLVDMNGNIVAQSDELLATTGETSSQWRPTRYYVTATVLPIDSAVPRGLYRLHLGVYDAATLERLWIVDENNQPLEDKLTIEPFILLP
jgi:hypothetical protein